MVKAQAVVDNAPKYLGTPYNKMDCQAYVEAVLRDAGINKNLAGSNAWFREVKAHGWVGTPNECKAKYGSIPPGAFLFVLKQDGKEPEKYKGDGIGNASHIGIYTAMTGDEMCAISGNPYAQQYNFGSGAINSSNSRGFVCTSKFQGKAISGGWNRIGLWNRINYGGGGEVQTYKAKVVGGALNLRKEPSRDSARITQIPDGATVTVTQDLSAWSKVEWNGITGYVMSDYLQKVEGEPSEDMISIPRKSLQEIYNKIGDLLKG